jgi:hypothetical protein
MPLIDLHAWPARPATPERPFTASRQVREPTIDRRTAANEPARIEAKHKDSDTG